MAGQDAFLTGAISRKLHLHARRLRIDHPDGGQIDVTAELPDHFAATHRRRWASIPALGDLPLDEVKFSETAEGKRKAASAAAKARRKERKGERRSRGGAADASQPRLRLGGPRRRCWPSSRDIAFCTICRRRAVRRPCAGAGRRARPASASTSRAATARRRSTAGARIISCLGPDAYISPDWYGTRRPGADLELSRGRGRRAAAAARRGRSWSALLDDAQRRARGAARAQAAPGPAPR